MTAHRCPRGHRVAPTSPVGSCPRCDAIQRAEDARLRRVCCWCASPHPTDGRGPILPGEPVSHGICPVARDAVLAGRPVPALVPLLEIPGPVGMGWEDTDPDGDFLGGFGR